MKKREDIEQWYEENENTYKGLAKKVKNLIEELLEAQDILFNSVSGRRKDKKSFCDKAMKEKYDKPTEQIKDLAGIRIIAYFNSDVKKICKIIEEEFDIDYKNSINKTEALGTDKVGYMSVHYIAKFKENRCILIEYSRYKDLDFEIQVRTLLQHAWAEIEHDRNYKFSGVLPSQIKRKFSLVAGMLEIADIQFDEISNEIDSYAEEVSKNTKEGHLNGILIDSTSINEYLQNKFKDNIDKGLLIPQFGGGSGGNKIIIDELNKFGVITLDDLNTIIEKNYQKSLKSNFSGLMRHYMMKEDAEKYFSKCWSRSFQKILKASANLLEKSNPNIFEVFNRYGIEVY